MDEFINNPSRYRPVGNIIGDVLGNLEDLGGFNNPLMTGVVEAAGSQMVDGYNVNFISIKSAASTILNTVTCTSYLGTTAGFNTTSAGVSVVSSTEQKLPPFPRSLKCTIDGSVSEQGAVTYNINVDDPTALYTAGLKVFAPVGFPGRVYNQEVKPDGTAQDAPLVDFTGTGDWQLVKVANQFSTGNRIRIYCRTRATVPGGASFYIGAVKVVKGDLVWQL